MRVSLIIPAYNAEKTLAECLEACLNQTHPASEIIVVDDGSTDATAEIARRYSVMYVNQRNQGPAAARNHGARIASGEFLAFTDADCIPEPHWLERLLAGFDAPEIAGVGGSYGIRNTSHLLARLVHEEIKFRHEHFNEYVDFLGSFNVAYRRDAFEAAGGFDETFAQASGEDNDLAYRLSDRGGKLRFAPEARVAHYHPTRLGPYLRTQMRHGFWRMRLYAKHPARTGGDDYASIGELLGPPTALAIAAGILLVPLVQQTLFTYAVAALIIAYLAPTASLTRAILKKLGVARALAFRGMSMLRDVARGLGLIRGVWTFVLLKRRTA